MLMVAGIQPGLTIRPVFFDMPSVGVLVVDYSSVTTNWGFH